ncbi:hypothetical protein Efla_003015 [Eimeria flavescens]
MTTFEPGLTLPAVTSVPTDQPSPPIEPDAFKFSQLLLLLPLLLWLSICMLHGLQITSLCLLLPLLLAAVAFDHIDGELSALSYYAGDEPLVHQPTWLALRATGDGGEGGGIRRGVNHNRVAFPEDRASLLHQIPSIESFLLRHGLAAAAAAAALVVLPLLHLLRLYEVHLTVGPYEGDKLLRWLDRVACCCLLLCGGLGVYWWLPSYSLSAKRQQTNLQQYRCAPLNEQQASLLPVRAGLNEGGSNQNEVTSRRNTEAILVLINTGSGAGSALMQYQQIIVPLLEKGGRRVLLPIVLGGGSSDFLFLFLFAFSHLFSSCLLLGGDGTYNTVTNLLMQVSAVRRAGETAAATAAAAAALEDEAAARREEEVAACRREEEEAAALLWAGGGDLAGSETAPTTRKNSRLSDSPARRGRRASRISSSRSRSSSSSSNRRIQQLIIQRDEQHRMALTPVPVGTSNTWCSEFLFSAGGRAAGLEYVADLTREVEAIQLQITKLTEEEAATRPATVAAETAAAEAPAAAATAEEAAGAAAVEEPAAAEAAAAAALEAEALKAANQLLQTDGQMQQEPAAEEAEADDFAAAEEAWDRREVAAEEEVTPTDKAAAAAARTVRKHSKAAAACEANEHRRQAFLFAARAALAMEKRLLHPGAQRQKEQRKQQHQATLHQLRQRLAHAKQRLEGLTAFVESIGPGKDSSLTQKGTDRMLQFWGRRIAEGHSIATSILKVQTGGHLNYCVNSLEFGYLGTCMVHSEDLRRFGHLRYTLAPLYQLIKMKKQHITIRATLANGQQIKRSGHYLAVAMDVIQHWTDALCATPWAQLNSDFAWLLLIGADVSRPRLLAYSRYLHQLGPDCPGVERLPVKKVSLQMEEAGVFGLDGEVYRHDGHLMLEVLPQAARVIASKHDVEHAGPASHPQWALQHLTPPSNKAN